MIVQVPAQATTQETKQKVNQFIKWTTSQTTDIYLYISFVGENNKWLAMMKNIILIATDSLTKCVVIFSAVAGA